MKYKLYFGDLTHTGIGINANTFPYGIGMVAAYALSKLKELIDVKIFKFPETFSYKLLHDMPHIVCLSNYAWNSNLTYAFADYIKKVSPEVIVILGGTNFPIEQNDRKKYLEKRPAIDFYIKGDGEHALTGLLKRLIDHDLKADILRHNSTIIENTCYLSDGKYIEGPDQSVRDLMSLPSPYLMGLLDNFFDYPLMPIIETVRGCPYSCTFCNDGVELRNKIFRKSPEFLYEELGYIAQRSIKSHQLYISDLNFGMYEKDLQTSRIIRSIIDKYNWPTRIDGSMGKSHPDRLIHVSKIINDGNKGILKLKFSLQTTDDYVLKKVGRKNLSIKQLLRMKDYINEKNNYNLEFFTELILALPGDSKKKHYSTLRDVLDVLGMNNIDIHQLTILHGSRLGTYEYQREFDLQVKYRVFIGCVGLYNIAGEKIPIGEIEEIVVSNRTLSFDDYIECRVMSLLVKIYMDHDPFQEVFGVLRYMKISVFDILLHLKEHIFIKYESLNKLVKSFIKGSVKPLFDNYGDTLNFVTKTENMQKFISGEYGQNELLNHRAMAYMDCRNDLSSALKEAVSSYLKLKKIRVSGIQEYLDEAIEFGKLRAFELENYKQIKEGEFTIDFIEADKHAFEVNPSKLKRGKVKYKFHYDNADISEIESMVKFFGSSTIHQVGKIYQKGNILLLRRKVSLA